MTYIDRPEPGVTKITGGFEDSPALRAWPVTSIFMNFGTANPATLLGGGTWVPLGQGRVLMGYDEGLSEFNTIGAMDGDKDITLTVANLPPHHHEAGTLATSSDGGHNHTVDRRDGAGGSVGVARGSATDAPDDNTGSGGLHNHDVTGNTADTGAATPYSNLPPYIVVSMWRRTA